jgi:hypothetical protein
LDWRFASYEEIARGRQAAPIIGDHAQLVGT